MNLSDIDGYWPDTGDFSIDESAFQSDHLETLKRLHETPKVVKWINERIEKEVKGAYRAGYNYIYIGEPRTPLDWEPDTDKFTISYHAIPSYTPVREWDEPLPKGSDWVWREYDLTELSPEEYVEFIQHGEVQ